MKVAVLGCGPAGLFAAEAAAKQGHDVSVLSKRQVSRLPGAQYLHAAIDGITLPSDAIRLQYEKVGTAQGYAKKVYGNPDAPCSWDQFKSGIYVAFNIHQVYERLWAKWDHRIQECEVTGPKVMAEIIWRYDRVISSIPASVYCYDDAHDFPGQEVWIMPKAHRQCGKNQIIYNGSDRWPWYRTSNINGHGSTEFSQFSSVPAEFFDKPEVWRGIKPLDTNCDCFSQYGVLRVGRFGRWRKGVLVHHAYREVLHALH